jgi:hypothetical protein
MNGKVYFDSLAEMAEFLKSFTGSTATFEAKQHGSKWMIVFLGGF